MEEVTLESFRCIRSEGWGLLPYLPTIMFLINYFVFLNRAIKFTIPRRHRVATGFRWCMAFTLACQVYEIWTQAISFVTYIFYDYLDVYPALLSSAVLTMAALSPLFGTLALTKRQDLRFSWVVHGPRSELGPMNYYLRRPPPMANQVLSPSLTRSRSQQYAICAPRSKGNLELPRLPRSA